MSENKVEEERVVAFQNTNPYPVSFFIKGIRNKVFIDVGKRILDKDKVPIIPLKSEWDWLIKKGVKPVSVKIWGEPNVTTLPQIEEVVLDDQKLMEANAAAKQKEAAVKLDEMITPVTFTAEGGIRPTEEVKSHLEDPENPNPLKADLVWQNADGEWCFNKDGFKTISPPELKKHIRKNYGKDYLEGVEWVSWGSVKTEEKEEDKSTS
jgi:hypothetical protein